MVRLGLILAFVALLLIGTVLMVRGIGRAVRRVDEGKDYDMAGDGMLPKLAYGLLIALILYATLTATGS